MIVRNKYPILGLISCQNVVTLQIFIFLHLGTHFSRNTGIGIVVRIKYPILRLIFWRLVMTLQYLYFLFGYTFLYHKKIRNRIRTTEIHFLNLSSTKQNRISPSNRHQISYFKPNVLGVSHDPVDIYISCIWVHISLAK